MTSQIGYRSAMKMFILCVIGTCIYLSPSRVAAQNFYTIDFRNARSTICTAINTKGEIGGYYIDQKHVAHGFYSRAHLLHTVHIPYSFASYVWGVDEAGNLAGTWGYSGRQSGYSGFIISRDKVLQYVFVTDTFDTEVLGISPTTKLVTGFDVDSDYQYFGFSNIGGFTYNFMSVQYPGGIRTTPRNGNDQNQIVGTYQGPLGGEHGFYFDGVSQYMNMDYPGALTTTPSGINNAGEIVGTYQTSDHVHHGFIYMNGAFVTVDFPGATDSRMYGLNSIGAIAGQYTDVSGIVHGFIELP